MKRTNSKDDLIFARHKKCGRTWKVSRNLFKTLWCPYCKTSDKFIKVRHYTHRTFGESREDGGRRKPPLPSYTKEVKNE